MENKQKLEILKNKKDAVENDLQRSLYESEFYNSLEESDTPEFAKHTKEHYQAETELLQKKADWYDLKIEELTAIIENTN
jgi:hypothetical protein